MAFQKRSLSSVVLDNEMIVRRAFVVFYGVGAAVWMGNTAIIADQFLTILPRWSRVEPNTHPLLERLLLVAMGLFFLLAVFLFAFQIIAAFSITRRTNYLICLLSMVSLCFPFKGVWPMLLGFLGFAFFTALPLPTGKSKA
jgi:hypothetical protein